MMNIGLHALSVASLACTRPWRRHQQYLKVAQTAVLHILVVQRLLH
jgi:hypothetical protein